MADEKSFFDVLNNVNVSDHTEGRDGLTYLSWCWAYAEVKKRYPDMQYEVVKFDGLPYVYDEKTGYMVYTTVTIQGITHEMWLPVMDSKNKAMKAEPYTYTTKHGDKTVDAATMFDINKTIMRCLTKNLAMHGLGLYIYAGEDLPEAETIKELKDLYKKAGGKDFDKWVTDCGGITPATYPNMKATLLKKINAKAEESK